VFSSSIICPRLPFLRLLLHSQQQQSLGCPRRSRSLIVGFPLSQQQSLIYFVRATIIHSRVVIPNLQSISVTLAISTDDRTSRETNGARVFNLSFLMQTIHPQRHPCCNSQPPTMTSTTTWSHANADNAFLFLFISPAWGFLASVTIVACSLASHHDFFRRHRAPLINTARPIGHNRSFFIRQRWCTNPDQWRCTIHHVVAWNCGWVWALLMIVAWLPLSQQDLVFSPPILNLMFAFSFCFFCIGFGICVWAYLV